MEQAPARAVQGSGSALPSSRGSMAARDGVRWAIAERMARFLPPEGWSSATIEVRFFAGEDNWKRFSLSWIQNDGTEGYPARDQGQVAVALVPHVVRLRETERRAADGESAWTALTLTLFPGGRIDVSRRMDEDGDEEESSSGRDSLFP